MPIPEADRILAPTGSNPYHNGVNTSMVFRLNVSFKAAVPDTAYVNAAPVKNLQGSELYKNSTNVNYDWCSLDLF